MKLTKYSNKNETEMIVTFWKKNTIGSSSSSSWSLRSSISLSSFRWFFCFVLLNISIDRSIDPLFHQYIIVLYRPRTSIFVSFMCLCQWQKRKKKKKNIKKQLPFGKTNWLMKSSIYNETKSNTHTHTKIDRIDQ